jgi:hypothetical protein
MVDFQRRTPLFGLGKGVFWLERMSFSCPPAEMLWELRGH